MSWPITLVVFLLQEQTVEISIPLLINEVHQMREELVTMSALAQSAQLLLLRIQAQNQVVTIARAEHNRARDNILACEFTRNGGEAVKKIEDHLATVRSALVRTYLEERLAEMRKNLLEAQQQEPALRAAKDVALAKLNDETAKLDSLYAKLAELIKQMPAP